jgi:TetR/AcrR family transcriptional regulator, cholesterol catabolism regulator
MKRTEETMRLKKSPNATLDGYLQGGSDAWRRVIDAAARLFCERGYAVVTMHDIAKAVGLSKAGLYHHCPSKDQILADIVWLCGEILLHQLKEAEELDAVPRERLRAFVISRMETIAQYQDLFTIIWQERPYIDRESFSGIAKSAERYRAGVRKLIETAKSAGELRNDIDTHLLMLAIDGMTGWAYIWFQRGGSDNPARIGEAFWSFLAEGVSPAATQSQLTPRRYKKASV